MANQHSLFSIGGLRFRVGDVPAPPAPPAPARSAAASQEAPLLALAGAQEAPQTPAGTNGAPAAQTPPNAAGSVPGAAEIPKVQPTESKPAAQAHAPQVKKKDVVLATEDRGDGTSVSFTEQGAAFLGFFPPDRDNFWIEQEDLEARFLISPEPGTQTTYVVNQDRTGDLPAKDVPPVDASFSRMGSKSELLEELRAIMPRTHTYVECFGGAFRVLLGKGFRAKVEIINEIDGDIVHFYRYARHDPDRLIEAINALPKSEALIRGLRKELGSGLLKGNALARAAAFYVSTVTSFNGTNTGYASSPYSTYSFDAKPEDIKAVAERLRSVDIRARSFEEVIESANKKLDALKYPPGGVFFYLDPPYYGTHGYKRHDGVESTFGWKEQVRLSELCTAIDKMGNLFLQTNSNHPDLRKLYGDLGFRLSNRDVYYCFSGQAEARKEVQELLISNYDLEEMRKKNTKQQGLF